MKSILHLLFGSLSLIPNGIQQQVILQLPVKKSIELCVVIQGPG